MQKIVAINGSPHGKDGNTIYSFQYAQKQFPEVECHIFHVASSIKKIENDINYFNSIIDEILGADAVFWVFPTYVFLIPSQFKRFIELIWERNVEHAFKGKYATSISTSIHFCDDLALNYIHGISEDLNMKYMTGYSADMRDIDKPEERNRLSLFAQRFKNIVENKISLPRVHEPIEYKPIEYRPENIQSVPKTKNYKMLLITDAEKNDVNLLKMIEIFTRLLPNPVETVNLNDININGCIGCGNCQFNVGHCVSEDNDDYNKMIREKIKNSDALIFASKIKDRYFSAKWKQMEDRRFVDNHCPLWNGKQILYLISGPLRVLSNVNQLLHISKQVNEAEIASIVTDEYETSEEITNLIKASIDLLFWNLNKEFRFPHTFVGVGSRKLFRDFVWDYQFAFPGDHKYYKEHGYYDFPKTNLFRNLFQSIILQNEKTRNFFGKKMSLKNREKRKSLLEEKLM